MARAYLNSASFPADSLAASMQLLGTLRAGLAHLIREQSVAPPVMCSLRASKLPLSPDYELLADGLKIEGGRHRDTVLFFLSTLDQQSPAQAALDPVLQEEMNPHLVERDLESPFDPDAGAVLVACSLDSGVLLSLASHPRWRDDTAAFDIMTSNEDLRTVHVDNVCNAATAAAVARRSAHDRARLTFDNWSPITGGAIKAPQLDEWFKACRRSPGLEQLVMRSVGLAHANDYRADGELIKKLASETDISVFEVRAYFAGSNNVRLLFARDSAGRIVFGFGGQKSHANWYENAIPQAVRFIRDQG